MSPAIVQQTVCIRGVQRATFAHRLPFAQVRLIGGPFAKVFTHKRKSVQPFLQPVTLAADTEQHHRTAPIHFHGNLLADMSGSLHAVQVLPERGRQHKTIICGQSSMIREAGIHDSERVSGYSMMSLRHITPILVNKRYTVKGVPFRVCGIRKVQVHTDIRQLGFHSL